MLKPEVHHWSGGIFSFCTEDLLVIIWINKVNHSTHDHALLANRTMLLEQLIEHFVSFGKAFGFNVKFRH